MKNLRKCFLYSLQKVELQNKSLLQSHELTAASAAIQLRLLQKCIVQVTFETHKFFSE